MLNKVPGCGKAKNATRNHWLKWIRENKKPWAHPKPSIYKQFAKRRKAKIERKRAREDPEVLPCYGRYRGCDD